ncbi:MAG: TolC family protein [Bacteroidaceae bacterium]|nr:TolC family protein [Bacteroidaceae bacterium]
MLLSTTGIKAQANSSEASMKMDITLSKAIEIALAENPTIKVADKEIELKKIADQEAWQTLLPEVSVNGSLQHTILAAEMKLNNQSFKMGKDGTNTVAGVATLNMPIFAPAVYKTMSLTKTDIKLAQEKARSSRLDLVNQVTKAFDQMLLAQDSYEVMQQSYKISKENYDIVNAKYKQGAVSEYDKISAEVQMRGMSSSLVSTETALSLAQLQLKVLMGITADVKLNINDKLENYEQNLILANIGNDEASLENNSAVRQIELNRELLEKNRKILKTGFMPTIGFQLSGQYQSLYNNNFNLFDYKWSPSASFTLSVSVPIFKASNFTKLRSNKLQLSTLNDTRTNTIRQLNMAMDSYAKNMASSIAQVNSNKQAVEQANKAVSIASKRYEIGGGTILELNQSEVALTQAKLTYNQSIYDYLTNKADLDYTLGRENHIK